MLNLIGEWLGEASTADPARNALAVKPTTAPNPAQIIQKEPETATRTKENMPTANLPTKQTERVDTQPATGVRVTLADKQVPQNPMMSLPKFNPRCTVEKSNDISMYNTPNQPFPLQTPMGMHKPRETNVSVYTAEMDKLAPAATKVDVELVMKRMKYLETELDRAKKVNTHLQTENERLEDEVKKLRKDNEGLVVNNRTQQRPATSGPGLPRGQSRLGVSKQPSIQEEDVLSPHGSRYEEPVQPRLQNRQALQTPVNQLRQTNSRQYESRPVDMPSQQCQRSPIPTKPPQSAAKPLQQQQHVSNYQPQVVNQVQTQGNQAFYTTNGGSPFQGSGSPYQQTGGLQPFEPIYKRANPVILRLDKATGKVVRIEDDGLVKEYEATNQLKKIGGPDEFGKVGFGAVKGVDTKIVKASEQRTSFANAGQITGITGNQQPAAYQQQHTQPQYAAPQPQRVQQTPAHNVSVNEGTGRFRPDFYRGNGR